MRTRAAYIPSPIPPSEPTVISPAGPPGSTLVTATAYPNLFWLDSGEIVNTYVVDFSSVVEVDRNWWKTAFDRIAPQIVNQGEQVLAYAVWVRVAGGIWVPEEVCLPGLPDYCWHPPYAGQSFLQSYEYRLWVLTRAAPVAPLAYEVRAAIPVAILLAIIASILTVVGLVVNDWRTGQDRYEKAASGVMPPFPHYRLWVLTRPRVAASLAEEYRAQWGSVVWILGSLILAPLAAGILGFLRGDVTWDQIAGWVKSLFRTPGQVAGDPIRSLAWPFTAIGFAMVAASIAIPYLSAKADVKVPIKGAEVTVTGELGRSSGSGRGK